MGRLGKQAWLEACRGQAEKKSALAGGGEVDILGLQASKQWALHKFTSKRWLCTLLGHSLHSLHCLHYFLGQSDHTGAAAVLYASFNAFELHLFLTFSKKLAQRTLGWGARGVQTTQGMFKSIDAKIWPPASEEMQRSNRTARLTLVAWSKFCSYAWNRFSVAVLCQ